MNVEFLGDPDFPIKLLDTKEYVRINPDTGQPELIIVEPMMRESGELVIDVVTVTVDNGVKTVMEREAVEQFIADCQCSPLEVTAHWKHRIQN